MSKDSEAFIMYIIIAVTWALLMDWMRPKFWGAHGTSLEDKNERAELFFINSVGLPFSFCAVSLCWALILMDRSLKKITKLILK